MTEVIAICGTLADKQGLELPISLKKAYSKVTVKQASYIVTVGTTYYFYAIRSNLIANKTLCLVPDSPNMQTVNITHSGSFSSGAYNFQVYDYNAVDYIDSGMFSLMLEFTD